MFGEETNLRGGSPHAPPRTALWRHALSGAIAIARWITTGGTLATRVLAAGILLVVGLPLLTVLLYGLGYPATPAPRSIVILVDGMQVLIVAYAVVATAQLLAYAGAVVIRVAGGVRHPVPSKCAPTIEVSPTTAPAPQGWATLREGARRLADGIWAQEQRGRPEYGPAALTYVRDAVMLEVEHRRRAAALQRRASELEAWLAQDSVVASERM